jgi:DNA invertase Pin-like site-specific DNA recombinase
MNPHAARSAGFLLPISRSENDRLPATVFDCAQQVEKLGKRYFPNGRKFRPVFPTTKTRSSSMATFAYGRVSTREQDTENQRLELERAGFQIDFWFADSISGKVSAMQRPRFKDLMGKIRDGETLVVSKLDRLGRDAPDVGATIKLLASRNVEVVVHQLGKLDLTSPAGKLMLAMLAAVAEMEHDLLVERTQSGLARANAEGKHLGRSARTTARDRTKIMALHDGGMSLQKIADQFGIGKATVHDVIKAAKASAPSEQPAANAAPAQVHERVSKAATAREADDMTDPHDPGTEAWPAPPASRLNGRQMNEGNKLFWRPS